MTLNIIDIKIKIYISSIVLSSFSCFSICQGKSGVYFDTVNNHFYKWVLIGEQVWMAENLKVTKFNNGTAIPLVTDNSAWNRLSTPGYCWYNNDSVTNAPLYGAIYNWYALKKGKLCPAGWHVPNDKEWTILTDYLGGENLAGCKLKEAGIEHWNTPNVGATNESGFTALPGGYRESSGRFNVIVYGYWWTATKFNNKYAWYRNMAYDRSVVDRNHPPKKAGFYIRCVRDN